MDHLSTGWTGDWRTLSHEEMLARADMLEKYYNELPEGVSSEAWAEAQLIRMKVGDDRSKTASTGSSQRAL